MNKEPRIYLEELGKLLPLPEKFKPIKKVDETILDRLEYENDMHFYNSWLNSGITVSPELKEILKDGGVYDLNEFGIEDCETCGGDGKETCNNPDHGLIGAMGFHDIGRIGCPVCGHDPNFKVKNGGACDQCDGKGKVAVPLPQAIEDKPLSEQSDIENEANSPKLTPQEFIQKTKAMLKHIYESYSKYVKHEQIPDSTCNRCGGFLYIEQGGVGDVDCPSCRGTGMEYESGFDAEGFSEFIEHGIMFGNQPFLELMDAQIIEEQNPTASNSVSAVDWEKDFSNYCLVNLKVDVEEIFKIIDYIKTNLLSTTQQELQQLRQWKKEALEVMQDFQEIGRLLRIPLGHSVSENIITYIKKLLSTKEEVKEVL
jgi:hypothetical protein